MDSINSIESRVYSILILDFISSVTKKNGLYLNKSHLLIFLALDLSRMIIKKLEKS